ncbi:hypothetical protein C8Q80DRAFT_1190963 [Daedaleopsis nitida]|nr:hypothetical protein C8Q80DRAFT_1190963 [Daedaleopsis nitida]
MNATETNIPSVPTPAQLTKILVQTTGALFMAAFFSTMLYGLLLHQAYRYFRLHEQDVMLIKMLVIVVVVVETVYTICNIHYCYFDFVTKYGTMEPFVHIEWSGNLLPVIGIFTSFVTHIFFIRRVSLVSSRYKILAFFAILFHLVQNSFGLALTIRGFITSSPDTYTKLKWMIGTTFGVAIMADLSISGALLAVMIQGRSSYKRNGPRSFVDTITIYFINTGLLVLLLDIVTLGLALGPSDNLYWAAVNEITARVYTNTLLSVLNSRKLHAAQGIEIFNEGSSTGLRTIARANRMAAIERWNVPEEPDPGPKTITINVTTEREDEDMSRQGSHRASVDLCLSDKV